MSDRQEIRMLAPSCPVCRGETDVKQIHREPERELVVYKCRACAVEYPVVTPPPQ
jgi:hypothetical protein